MFKGVCLCDLLEGFLVLYSNLYGFWINKVELGELVWRVGIVEEKVLVIMVGWFRNRYKISKLFVNKFIIFVVLIMVERGEKMI